MSDSPIGLIGVGLLGTALAERMVAAGLAVLAFDIRPSQATRLRDLGGHAAGSMGEVGDSCSSIVLCLPDSNVVKEVVNQLGDRLASGKLLIDATTGNPDETVALAQELADRGVGYIDATIAGSSAQVRSGEAVVVVGGRDENVQTAQLILETWSEHRFHVGPPGSGARLKLVINLVLGLNRAALAEGLSLATACGIDPAAALEVLKTTPAYSAVMDSKGPKMIAGDYTPQARLAQHLKDVRLIQALAKRHGTSTSLTDVHQALLEAAVNLGYGDADNSAVIEAYRRKTMR
jgi:3-hydroxyisobutyrate dehydrogenase